MDVLMADEISKYSNWTALVYSQPGIGKTTMVKTLKGKTVVFSVDGMYHVLSGLPNVSILRMDSKNPSGELGDFYKWVLKNLDKIDNIVIDNLSTFQKFWLNVVAKETKSGMPEIKDYGIVDRVLLDFVSSMKDLGKNLLIFAHERTVEVTKESGGVYTQFQPDVRNLDAIMGIVPIVGRLLVVKDQEKQTENRIVVLQPTLTTRAKDQLIGDLQTIDQMELLPTLQSEI